MLGKLLAKLTGSKGPKKKAAKKKPAGPKKKPAKRASSARKKVRRPAPKKRPASKKKKVSRPKAKVKPKQRKAAPSKKRAAASLGDDIGEVIAFFRIPVVAVIKLKKGSLKVGDRIMIHGHTTNIKLLIASMQIDHEPVPQIKKGDEAGIKVPSRARRGDRIYRI